MDSLYTSFRCVATLVNTCALGLWVNVHDSGTEYYFKAPEGGLDVIEDLIGSGWCSIQDEVLWIDSCKFFRLAPGQNHRIHHPHGHVASC